MPPQQAFDHIGELLNTRYKDWYMALAELPLVGEALDSQVQTYVTAVQNAVIANLNWRCVSKSILPPGQNAGVY